jgi:hypothetical protein
MRSFRVKGLRERACANIWTIGLMEEGRDCSVGNDFLSQQSRKMFVASSHALGLRDGRG